uniref:Uncharacterized protein n=1 Tax=Globodera rostochiensis TaxID=31243 RepID=A0A914H7U7_GLORO
MFITAFTLLSLLLLYCSNSAEGKNCGLPPKIVCRKLEGTEFHAQCMGSSLVKERCFIPKHLRPPWLNVRALFGDNKIAVEETATDDAKAFKFKIIRDRPKPWYRPGFFLYPESRSSGPCYACYKGTNASRAAFGYGGWEEDYCMCAFKNKLPNAEFARKTFPSINLTDKKGRESFNKMARMPSCGNNYYDYIKHCSMVHFYENNPNAEPKFAGHKHILALLDGCILTPKQKCEVSVKIEFKQIVGSFFSSCDSKQMGIAFESSLKNSSFTLPVLFKHRQCRTSLFNSAYVHIPNTFTDITITISGECGTKRYKIPTLEFNKGRVQEMRGLQLDLHGGMPAQWRDPMQDGCNFQKHAKLKWQPTDLKHINQYGKPNVTLAYP